MNNFIIRPARAGDEPSAYHICLKTGHHGEDGERLYADDPDALGRIFVGPYLAFELALALILEDAEGICGYTLGALDSHIFYERYETEWRPSLCERFPAPKGHPDRWTPVQRVYDAYHHPDYFCPEPYEVYPSHLHIDLLPRGQGRGHGRLMLEQLMNTMRNRGSPGAHLGVSALNSRARAFYTHLGFRELARTGSGEHQCVYMGMTFSP